MAKTGVDTYHIRGRDLCHLAFRQTLDLLRVTDQTLEQLCTTCPTVPDLESLVLRALKEVALGEGAEHGVRAPTHVFLVHSSGRNSTGIVYAASPGGYKQVLGPFQFETSSSYAYSAGDSAVVLSNYEDEGGDLDRYQSHFLAPVREAVGVPIRNFITYRIAGAWPGALVAFNYPERATRYEAQVLSALSVTLGSIWTLASRVAQVEEAFLYLVGALAKASEVNDEVTGAHLIRVSECVKVLARAVGFSPEEVNIISYSAKLHDVGKIHTSEDILKKPGPLTPDEQRIMREHTLRGEEIIGSSARLQVARKIAGAHHENWDGSGYPRGLHGEEIPREARLVKVVDVYDAIRSQRPYKPSRSHEEACEILLYGDDRIAPSRHFDPRMLDAFRDQHPEFQRIHAAIQG